ncbi:YiiX/YebB-like N1pC/P60 family cysteine hydrolase [Nitrosomonas oligotropha]|uniref:Permuted papain-like amidase enzyme, YaeF/YiiX, C92 family n=1 Tax=Nitrosomonas oligotropha TaxID=42354 RepID=A0A1H8SE95_9PROT|nr:YiiX/YebB-like N1pC/P60 family cysteine hydrolase [Nitrosomonas oligotropha]SDX12287.1 Permuted papain-like amidase enzyme, YaeF/YiiX, C92 family [Nitrosomonas oligotropha]SEO76674.1 Permuted papain-like amidase enzyme, YaeF/YiiX, C92 family [Nitrosomonas oligotropha]
MGQVTEIVGRGLAHFLTKPVRQSVQVATISQEKLAATLQPGDVLLVEGDTRVSVAIKYLTQSTWSHAAIYIGNVLPHSAPWQLPQVLIEADLKEGVRAITLAHYAQMHTRICRPVGLNDEDRKRVVDFVIARIGQHYDLKHIFDLLRYLLPTMPVPTRFRRRMLALGSGDPTRAICSTLIAQAFESVRYPILPEIQRTWSDDPRHTDCYADIYHIRHYSLYTPRDFDISPYFDIIKPVIENGFDYRSLAWSDKDREPGCE